MIRPISTNFLDPVFQFRYQIDYQKNALLTFFFNRIFYLKLDSIHIKKHGVIYKIFINNDSNVRLLT